MIESLRMDYQYQYPIVKKSRGISPFLQILFLGIGILLIVSFILIFRTDPEKVEALYSPLAENSFQNQDQLFSYQLLSAKGQQILYKETVDNTDKLKLVELSDNSTDNIATAKRIGFGGYLNNHTFLYLVDNEGLSQFTVYQYNLYDHTSTAFIKFKSPSDLTSFDINQLVDVAKDETHLAINQQSGIILYNIDNTEEQVILEHEICTADTCKNYRQPVFMSDDMILVNQVTSTKLTPMIVDYQGKVKTIFPENISQLSFAPQGLPVLGIRGNEVFLLDVKKTTALIQAEKDTIITSPIITQNAILTIEKKPSQSEVAGYNNLGKSRKVIKQFPLAVKLTDLISDNEGNVFFLSQYQNSTSINLDIYKIDGDLKVTNLYSIAKSL